MAGQDIKIDSAEGGRFDAYLALPASGSAPAMIIVPSVFGADDDVRQNVDDLAAQGFVAIAFDPFWRGDSGPLARDDDGKRRAKERGLNRAEIIERGVQDLADTMAFVKALPECNGRVAVVGLCYGGPYAILGPARLGCDAGISFHGTKVENYLDELDKVRVPLSLHWGDRDHVAPMEVLEGVREAVRGMRQAEVVIYPGATHGYAAPASPENWHEEATRKSWQRAIEILEGLREPAAVVAGA